MVNNNMGETAETSPGSQSLAPNLDAAYKITLAYAAWTVLTIIALVIFSATAPSLATSAAWGHAVVVVIFAVVLPLRVRAVRKNPTPRGVRRCVLIATVLLIVNVVEALLPTFPGWMRGEMTLIVFMMIGLLAMLSSRARARLARERERGRRFS